MDQKGIRKGKGKNRQTVQRREPVLRPLRVDEELQDSGFRAIQRQVYERLDMDAEIPEEMVWDIIDTCIFEESRRRILSIPDREKLRIQLFNAIRKLDILQELLEDDSITEIMVNGCDPVFVERQGRIEQLAVHFESTEQLEDIAQRIAASSNRVVNAASPIVDTRLQDGSRVSIVLPPVAVNGPAVTIRKFYENPLTIRRLTEMQSISEEAAQFLEKAVIAGYNIFVSGGTGSGKTTFLNALSNFIPEEERIITIEDSAELQLKNVKNLVSLEVRNANQDDKNAVSIRDLIRASLRMRPDRIIVGEVRGAEAIDMLQAMNTGHDGSLSTGHGNGPADMLLRLETMVLMGMEMPVAAIRQQVASALDLIVHLGRMRDKSRRVMEITEVLGCSGGEIRLRPFYCFREKGEKDGRIIGSLERQEKRLVSEGKMRAAGITDY